MSLDLTLAAQEAVGLGALALAVIVLVMRHRQWDAARLVVIAGAAWTAALVVKYFVHRPRPPAQLWVQPPGPTAVFRAVIPRRPLWSS